MMLLVLKGILFNHHFVHLILIDAELLLDHPAQLISVYLDVLMHVVHLLSRIFEYITAYHVHLVAHNGDPEVMSVRNSSLVVGVSITPL